MTPRRRSTLVSGLVLSLTLATAGSARAQFGFQGIPGQLPVSQFGLGYGSGTAPGITPFDGNSFGVFSGGYGVIDAYPRPGYGLSYGPRPQASISYQSVYDVVTVVPGWGGSAYRVRRRH